MDKINEMITGLAARLKCVYNVYKQEKKQTLFLTLVQTYKIINKTNLKVEDNTSSSLKNI